MQEVIGEVFFDEVALVATADDKLIDIVGGVNLQDMPQNWHTTNVDHGFGFKVGFLGNSCAESTGENDCFHGYLNLLALRSRSARA